MDVVFKVYSIMIMKRLITISSLSDFFVSPHTSETKLAPLLVHILISTVYS